MHLKADKMRSRRLSALSLRFGWDSNAPIRTWQHQQLMLLAAKTALAAAICWWVARWFGWHDGYWGSISAIIVLQSNVGSTVTASRDRILGTLIGALLGFAFSLLGSLPWNYILAVLAAVIVCGLLDLRNSSRLAAVTITIVMLVQKTGPRWTLALDRVGEVVLGIVVALAVTLLVLPDRAHVRLRDGLAREFLLLGAFFDALSQSFRGAPAENVSGRRADALAALRDNSQLLEAAKNDPWSGRSWREGLSLLSQAGQTLFDVLAALEFSVQDSHGDAFVQRLEPALGKLAVDVSSGFQYVAARIGEWRFDAAPAHNDLEEDIEQLEARMDQVRHTGIEFSQAEILRAYAVQLHLKQIARLLRAARRAH